MPATEGQVRQIEIRGISQPSCSYRASTRGSRAARQHSFGYAVSCQGCPAGAATTAVVVISPTAPRHCLTELISRVTPCSCSLPEQPRASPRIRVLQPSIDAR